MIEKGERQPWHEGVDPDREPGELDGQVVKVDAVYAASGDQAPKELAVVNRGALPDIP